LILLISTTFKVLAIIYVKDSSLLNGPGLLAPKGQDDLIALRKVLISTTFKVLAIIYV